MVNTVQADRVLPAIAGVGLDLEQLTIDMTAPEIAQRMQRDREELQRTN